MRWWSGTGSHLTWLNSHSVLGYPGFLFAKFLSGFTKICFVTMLCQIRCSGWLTRQFPCTFPWIFVLSRTDFQFRSHSSLGSKWLFQHCRLQPVDAMPATHLTTTDRAPVHWGKWQHCRHYLRRPGPPPFVSSSTHFTTLTFVRKSRHSLLNQLFLPCHNFPQPRSKEVCKGQDSVDVEDLGEWVPAGETLQLLRMGEMEKSWEGPQQFMTDAFHVFMIAWEHIFPSLTKTNRKKEKILIFESQRYKGT